MKSVQSFLLPLLPACLLLSSNSAGAADWEIPLGGNAYLTESAEGSLGRIEPGGIRQWQDPKSVFSVWFRADRAAVLTLGLRPNVPEGESVIRAACAGKTFEKTAREPEVRFGTVEVKGPGYVRVDLQGVRKNGVVFADASDLLVSSDTAGLKLDYVKDNEANRFYWGRRGPSVHLNYQIPAGKTIEWFYNEVTVPKGQDPIGSYFMANGFGQGYFGIQVKSDKERWLLFSVWSPFATDNPNAIPEDQRVKLLAKGNEVHGGEFGGEGSGGKSYLVYPWKAGTTYRFLNRARPDGKGNTIYTAWFFDPETGKWRLMASFQRPKTDTHLTGIHSFLENFADTKGYLGRGALYGNQWMRDTEGNWHESTTARFTGDDIANRGYRLDFAGGVVKDVFFMRNGGFFAENVKTGRSFERKPSGRKPPEIDFSRLEAVE